MRSVRWLAGSVIAVLACGQPARAPVANESAHVVPSVRDRVLAVTPHLALLIAEDRPALEPLVANIRAMDPDITSVAGVAFLSGHVDRANDDPVKVEMTAIPPEALRASTRLADYVVAGKLELAFDGGAQPPPAAIGTGLAARLHIAVGGVFHVQVGRGDGLPFRVAAIYETGLQAYDERGGFVDLSAYGGTEHYDAVYIELARVERVDEVKAILKARLQAPSILDWRELSEGLSEVKRAGGSL